MLIPAILKGTSLPVALLYMAIKRIRAEHRTTKPRIALIKATLLSNHYKNEFLERMDFMTKLEPDFKNPAYLCGRLMAVMENIQWYTLSSINVTVTDRFLGTASTSPASKGNYMLIIQWAYVLAVFLD